MRKDPWVTGEYYHVYNRGVDKRDIFMSQKDIARFVLSIKMFNDIKPSRSIKDKLLENKEDSDVGRPNRLVSVVCYCFNPNHFHFILKQEVEGGISEFFKRLSGGYTKYFNLVHGRSGALFQGRFKSKLIDNDAYLLRIRPYTHLNYMLHDIPEDKKDLVRSSGEEYDNENFELVSEVEARKVLDFYGGKENFKKESMEVVAQIREERGLLPLTDEELLP
jgi:putative transposase